MPTERYASEYNMRHNKRGMAIIFNHEHFDIPSLKSRTGTNVDCENLRHSLEYLQFDVIVYKDLRYADIHQKIEEREYRSANNVHSVDAENQSIQNCDEIHDVHGLSVARNNQ